jgi:hypothetical protein
MIIFRLQSSGGKSGCIPVYRNRLSTFLHKNFSTNHHHVDVCFVTISCNGHPHHKNIQCRTQGRIPLFESLLKFRQILTRHGCFDKRFKPFPVTDFRHCLLNRLGNLTETSLYKCQNIFNFSLNPTFESGDIYLTTPLIAPF